MGGRMSFIGILVMFLIDEYSMNCWSSSGLRQLLDHDVSYGTMSLIGLAWLGLAWREQHGLRQLLDHDLRNNY